MPPRSRHGRARGLQELRPATGSVVLIENVGNLGLRPAAMFDLGERAKGRRIVGDRGRRQARLKHPHMFAAASMMIVNKIDLLPHVDFSVDRAGAAHARSGCQPLISRCCWLSARCGKGLSGWYDWLRREAAAMRELAFA